MEVNEVKNDNEQKISEAVQNLVTTITETINSDNTVNNPVVSSETPTQQPVENITVAEPQYNPYYVEKIPFLVELKFDTWSQEVENKLMQCFMHDEELLPGLKVNKMYKATLHSDSLYLDQISETLSQLKFKVDDYRSELDCVMRRLVNSSKDLN